MPSPAARPALVALLLSARLCAAAPACHAVLGNIVAANLGPPVPAQTPADCCAACNVTAACTSWTFTAAGARACYLHPDGASGVDPGSPYSSGTCGDDAAYLDPLSPGLLDAPTRSGVPLGGVGVGWFDVAADGGISRVALSGWHQDNVLWADDGDFNATFLAVWRRSSGAAGLLQRRPSVAASAALPPAAHATAALLWPTANISLEAAGGGPPTVLRAWSALAPHDVVNSTLPAAWLEVTVDNSVGTSDDVASVAVSWQDVIARRLWDANASTLDRFYPRDPSQPCGWATNDMRVAQSNAGVDARGSLPRVATTAQPLSVLPPGGAPPLSGFEQRAAAPLAPHKRTLQHYVWRVAVLAELSGGAADSVSVLPAFVADAAGAAPGWARFAASGAFDASASFAPTPLFTPGAGAAEAASALALTATVPAGGSRTFRFLVTWWADELPAPLPGDDNRTFCGTGDYGKPYNAFGSLEAVAAHAAAARPALEAATRGWHAPLLGSSLPPWLAFKIINSAYTLYTNAILTRGLRFSMMEGGMGGLSGTMDQRMVAHIVYAKLFPALDAQELAQFGASQNTDGSINHFDALFYAGITGVDGAAPLGNSEYNDNTVGWLYQVAKLWQLTGDAALLALHAPRVARALAFLEGLRKSAPRFPTLISGSNTYDDFFELPLDTYLCSVYPLALEAGRILAEASGNESLAAACARDRDAAAAENVAALFNGEFFAYGAALDGSGRADNLLFGGQAAGQMLGRHAGWGDIAAPFAATQSALRAQLARQIGPSLSFYAPKVFNLSSGSRALDPRNGAPSSTWPFYLESYAAIAALQAGFVDDAFALLQNLQLVNARLGFTWTQNLWNPGSITYVAAPVSWFLTDVLAGVSLDVPSGTLFVSPLLRANESTVVWPVLLPQMWLSVAASRAGGGASGGSLTVTVTRAFADVAGGAPVVISNVAGAPLGTPAAASRRVALSAPWTAAEGATLDLSAFFELLVAPMLQPRVLPAVAP
jgi:uncharacterized protein (DUF608 family)